MESGPVKVKVDRTQTDSICSIDSEEVGENPSNVTANIQGEYNGIES